MSDRPTPTESASAGEVDRSASKKPRAPKGRGRGTLPIPPAPESEPSGSDAEAVIARTRRLLERLIRTAGYGWRDIDRRIHKNRGFTAHLLSKREGLPLNEVLAILDAIDVRYEDFFAVLFPKLEKPRSKKPVGEGLLDLLGDFGVPETPEEGETERDEQSRALWSRLDRITAVIDQRVLTLIESALSQPLQRPPRRAAEAPEASAGESSGSSVGNG